MKRIDINSINTLQLAINALSLGEIIVYPTDTIYGFGCDAKNDEAITKLNNLKGRQAPISIIAPDKQTAINWFNIETDEKKNCLKILKMVIQLLHPYMKV